jgi:lipoprotein-anchoring transpeptidase ErfK/SrfK
MMARLSALLTVLWLILVAGCSSSRPAVAPRDELSTMVATARARHIGIFNEPGVSHLRTVLASPADEPLVFIVRNSQSGWLQVELPTRPNGSTGWIRRSDASVTQHDFHIEVELQAHTIEVWRGSTLVDSEAIGVGKHDTPTPGGSYYTTALLSPPDPRGFYGPYVYTLSGHSDVLREFDGGQGVIGIHGTNEPWLIGRDVSHGCIRMSNAGISKLARILPLGVPVDIHP